MRHIAGLASVVTALVSTNQKPSLLDSTSTVSRRRFSSSASSVVLAWVVSSTTPLSTTAGPAVAAGWPIRRTQRRPSSDRASGSDRSNGVPCASAASIALRRRAWCSGA